MTTEIEEFTDRMVRNEVFACVSSIVADLANGYGEVPRGLALADLAEEAAELSYSVEDYEEALRGEGYRIEPTDSDDLPDFVKAHVAKFGGSFVIFDPHDDEDGFKLTGDTAEEIAREACDHLEIEPYQWEVFEHWIVSEWLGVELAKRGERVGPLGNLTVWARTTTGQSITMDGVIRRIAADCLADK